MSVVVLLGVPVPSVEPFYYSKRALGSEVRAAHRRGNELVAREETVGPLGAVIDGDLDAEAGIGEIEAKAYSCGVLSLKTLLTESASLD